MHRGVAVAVGDGGAAAGGPRQSADIAAGAAGGGGGGVAGDDAAAADAGDPAAAHEVSDGYGGGGVAGPDRARVVAGQPAAPTGSCDGDGAALDVAGGDFGAAANNGRQSAYSHTAAHVGGEHSDIPDHAAGGQGVEQPGGAGAGDGEVADGAAVAVKHRGVVAADGGPVGVVILRPHAAVAVGVEIQVRRQFVAQHPPDDWIPAGEGGVVGRGGGGREIRRRGPVAVQIPADGVQLRLGGDFGQAVVVGVVIGERHGALRRGVQRRVLPGGPETPDVIADGIVVDRYVPVGVDAGVALRLVQFGGGFGFGGHGGPGLGADAGGGCGVNLAIAIAVGDRRAGAAGDPGQAAGFGVGGGGRHRAGGVAGDDFAVIHPRCQSPDHRGGVDPAVHRGGGVAGADRALISPD